MALINSGECLFLNIISTGPDTSFHGLPEMPLNNIVIEDVDITASQSGRFAYSDSITMRRVRIKDASAGFTFSNCNAVDTVGIEYIK